MHLLAPKEKGRLPGHQGREGEEEAASMLGHQGKEEAGCILMRRRSGSDIWRQEVTWASTLATEIHSVHDIEIHSGHDTEIHSEYRNKSWVSTEAAEIWRRCQQLTTCGGMGGDAPAKDWWGPWWWQWRRGQWAESIKSPFLSLFQRTVVLTVVLIEEDVLSVFFLIVFTSSTYLSFLPHFCWLVNQQWQIKEVWNTSHWEGRGGGGGWYWRWLWRCEKQSGRNCLSAPSSAPASAPANSLPDPVPRCNKCQRTFVRNTNLRKHTRCAQKQCNTVFVLLFIHFSKNI